MELPKCVNFVKKRGCDRSDIILRGEGEDHWQFHCRTCKLVWVVSKPTAAVRGRLFKQEDDMRKKAEALRRRDSRPLYFT